MVDLLVRVHRAPRGSVRQGPMAPDVCDGGSMPTFDEISGEL